METIDKIDLFLNNILLEKVVKTEKGSTIKRSKYGVGKQVGPQIYLHSDYALDVVPKDILNGAILALEGVLPHFTYNNIVYNVKTHSVRFGFSKEFDSVPEPLVGDFVTVTSDGNVGNIKTDNKRIWHHKWLWVKDEYKGFDVRKEFERSEIWVTIPNINYSKIGNKNIWDREYIPKIMELLK